MIKNPCYNCTLRSPTCHSKCKAYNDWKKQLDEIKERDRSEKLSKYYSKRRF